ncbi:hypothetical protein HK101_000909 [Irineochytrium annulatum]|nr:hypothetical protein HK101_000909 [Irineochytrium annulatum]
MAEPLLQQTRLEGGGRVCALCVSEDHAIDACPNVQRCQEWLQRENARPSTSSVRRSLYDAGRKRTSSAAKPGGAYDHDQIRRFTDESEYFGYLGKDSLVGSYQLVTADTDAYWHKWMLNVYGPNNLTDGSFYFSAKNVTTAAKYNADAYPRPCYFVNLVSKDNIPSNNAALGFIADTDTVARKPLIQNISKSGATAASPRVRLASSTTVEAGILVMAPIFKNATTGNLQKGLTDQMYTIAFSAITCKVALQNALGVIALGDGVHVFLFDSDGAINTTFLAHYSAKPSPVFDNFTIAAPLTNIQMLSMINSDLVHREEFMFLERNWEVIVVAESGYINSQRTNFPVILIFIALIEPTVGLLLHATVMIMRLTCPHHSRDHV